MSYNNNNNNNNNKATCIKEPTDSSGLQESCPLLLKFLKRSKQDKYRLEQEHKQLYDYFSKIWTLRNDHNNVKQYPVDYLFYLFACCSNPICIHPLCQDAVEHDSNVVWYPGGPMVNHIPLSVPHKTRALGKP